MSEEDDILEVPASELEPKAAVGSASKATDCDVEDDGDDVGGRLPPEKWAQLIEERETLATSVTALSTKFGISRQAIHARLKKDGILSGSKRPSAGAAPVAPKPKTWNDMRAENIEAARKTAFILASRNDRLVAALQKEVEDGVLSAAAQKENVRSLKMMAEIFALNKTTKLDALQAETFTDLEALPSITIEDLTEKEIEAIRNATADADGAEDDGLGGAADDDEIIELS